MAEPVQDIDESGTPPLRRAGKPKLVWRWFVMPVLLILGLAIAAAWFQRQELARNAISDYFEDRGVPATYDIVSIGPERQVIENVVIGDPTRPDLTVQRIIVAIIPRLGLPTIRRVELQGARLYGSYRDGELSFGKLDPILLSGDGGEPELPDLDMTIRDGRALMQTDFGAVGIRLQGGGNLSGGFEGDVAMVASDLALGDCQLQGATLYGTLGVEARRPLFAGPVRLARAQCRGAGVDVANAALQLDAMVDADFKGVDSDYALRSGRIAAGGMQLASASGEGRASYRDDELNLTYALAGIDAALPQARFARLDLDGRLRALDGFGRVRAETSFAAAGLDLGSDWDATLASVADGADGTIVGSVVRKLRGALGRELPGSRLEGTASIRRTGAVTAVIVPRANVTGRGGRILALSDLQYAAGGSGPVSLSGRFLTGGRGLPRIEGRIDRRGSQGFNARLAMAEYVTDDGSLALPVLNVRSAPGGITFSGLAQASGPIPGGMARGLELPLSGSWQGGRLAMWDACTDVRFDALTLGQVALERQSLTLCPPRGTSIVRYSPAGLKIAAGTTSLRLAGRLGGTPIRIASGPVGLAWPGALSARDVDVSLGPVDTAARFRLSGLTAELGRDLRGRFEGTDVTLDAVPLDIKDAEGAWSYSGKRFAIADAAFVVHDRQEAARFTPLLARGAVLELIDNRIAAQAPLYHPLGDRLVMRTDIRHDLATSTGSADLDIPGLAFTRGFQPTDLTRLARGVVALVEGTVTGNGRIDWGDGGVRSTGAFSSDALDFSAAFGPVGGASGTVVFTDLLGLTTAPDQVIRVGTINPGIEVYDGEVRFQLVDGERVSIASASWPFMGGTLAMRPVTLNLGVSEERLYQFDIVGLEAAKFVQRMELNNFNASGTFDGTIPITFDTEGNGRIEGGLLTSRDPGGNVAYQGDLLYEDMPAMAKFAFEALRSLDFTRMRIALDGSLAGELVTRVRFDGVTQGEGASDNIITREFAKLPLRFDVNIRAPFQQLLGSVRSLYDPASIRDPRSLGLIDAEGRPIRRSISGEELPPEPGPLDMPDDAIIQRSESEDME